MLLPGDGSKKKVVIVMSGSNGGMKLTKQCAEFYHKNGVPALELALFATKGTQSYLDRVPVEYVEKLLLTPINHLLNAFEATKASLTNVAGSLKLCDNPKLRELGYRRINFLSHRYFMFYRVEKLNGKKLIRIFVYNKNDETKVWESKLKCKYELLDSNDMK